MNIVVLDGHTLNPGDLSWDELAKLGACRVYDRTGGDQVLARAAGAQIVLTNKTLLTAQAIEQLDQLRYVGVLATGYNVVDLQAARRRNIPVTNVPDYATPSVAQTVFAHLLNLTHHVAEHGQGVSAGRWSASIDFCYWDWPLVELEGLTMGIIGFGRIGRAVAAIASAFGMNVLAHDVRVPQPPPAGATMADLAALLRESDVVSLHCPLTEQTQRLIDAARLAMMKPSAFLINTSRGGVIDEQALADALNAGRIAGAGLDVLTQEPPRADNPLLSAKNCCITPHVAWASKAARARLMKTVVANVRAFLAGAPQNVVN